LVGFDDNEKPVDGTFIFSTPVETTNDDGDTVKSSLERGDLRYLLGDVLDNLLEGREVTGK